MKIVNVNKQTKNKYLNLFEVTYENDGKTFPYYLASRKEEDRLVCVKGNSVDAVRVIPYFYKDNKLFVVLIKEFRYAINQYMYSVPAGLVDDGESEELAVRRELLEEIGAEVVNIECTQKASFTSAGLTDEMVSCYEAEVKLVQTQQLDANEKIDIVIMDFDKLNEFIKNNQFGLQTALQLKEFIYKTKLRRV